MRPATAHERALATTLGRLKWPRGGTSAHRTAWLAEWLYRRYFIGWREPILPRGDFAGAPHFVAELASRVAGATTWEGGFRVEQRTPAGVFVSNDVVRLWVTDESGLWPRARRVGQPVAVRLPCGRESAIAGFFTVVSRAGRLVPDAPHLKLYLNVSPRVVPALLEGLVRDAALSRARFEAKVGNEPGHYGRRDTALLYVEPGDYRRVAAWVLDFRRRHRADFRAPTPPMTWPLAPGVSAAESPPDGDESFGAQRCRLVAEALVAARARGADWPPAVAERFRREGLDWARPWLGRLPGAWARRGAPE